MNTLNLLWGVRGFYFDTFINVDQTIEDIKNILKKEGYVKTGDLIINTASTPVNIQGMTNMIKLCKVDN